MQAACLQLGSVRAVRRPDALYVAAGWDPFALLDTAIPYAASIAGTARPRSQKVRAVVGAVCLLPHAAALATGLTLLHT